MRARKMVLGGLIVVMLLGLVGCGGGDDDETVLGGEGTADLVVRDELPFYEPKNLQIALNRAITFTVFNDGDEVHNITIPGFAIDMDVAPGQTIDVKIPAVSAAPRDGFFLFYCKFHQTQGMTGRIKISS